MRATMPLPIPGLQRWHLPALPRSRPGDSDMGLLASERRDFDTSSLHLSIVDEVTAPVTDREPLPRLGERQLLPMTRGKSQPALVQPPVLLGPAAKFLLGSGR
jgi:hypothetical protein